MPKRDHGFLLRRALVALLAAASPALAETPVIDPPVAVGGDVTTGLAGGDQTNAWVTAGGAGYLAVWTDNRTTLHRQDREAESGDDIYAMRLDASGQRLDASPFVVTADYGHQRYPRAAWNGSSWLVVWTDQKPSGSYHALDVYGIRVGADGEPLDAEPFLILDYDSSSTLYMDVTARGSEWLVVAQGTDSTESDIVGVRVASDGTRLDNPPVVLVPSTYYLRSRISIQSAGGEYLLVYEDNPDILGQRFTSELVPIGGTFGLPGAKVASSGSEYYVAWYSNSTFEYVGSPMSIEGSLDFPAGVSITSDPNNGYMVAWGGTQWWFLWLDPVEEIKLTRIDMAGNVLDPGGIQLDPTPVDKIQGAFVGGGPGGEAQVVWTRFDSPGLMPNDVHAAQVSASGQPQSSVEVSTGAPNQLRPDLVRGPDHFLAAVQSQRSGVRQLLLQRLDGLGQPLDPDPVVAVEDPELGSHAVDWNGSVYLAVWSIGEQVYGRRFAADLAPLDAEPFTIMEGLSPDVAALGDNFLVVATQQTISIHFYHPYAIRVGGDGSLLDPAAFQIGQYYTRHPSVAAVAGRWLAVWQRNYSHDDRRADVNATWIRPDGSFDPYFVVDFGGFEPKIAYSGARALIVFREGTLAAADQDVSARMMLPDGSMPDPTFKVSDAADKQRSPHVAWDGDHFLMAWEDRREAAAFFDERSDVYAARIAEDGTLVDPAGFPVASGDDPAITPHVVSAEGDTLVGASIFDRGQGLTAYRAKTYHLYGGETNPPDADFAADPADGCVPLETSFTDLSTGAADAWEWSFGDGATSGVQNPVHTYTQPGEYSVYLSARGAGGADTEFREHLITVSGNIDADFSASVTTGCAPLDVSFQDLSTGLPNAWVWNFGDDGYSHAQNPTHTYQYPGTYTVEMTASKCGGNTERKVELIHVTEMCPDTSLAHGETPVYGTMSNDHTWTHEKDGYNQVLQEETFGSGPNISTRMEHRWHFSVEAGASIGFHADITPYASFFENLAFEYSTDGEDFASLYVVDDPAITEVDAPLPSNVSGEVTIRLLDLDRAGGDDFRNTVNINHLRIDSRDAPPDHPCEAITGATFSGKDQIQWLAGASSTHYDVTRGDVASLRVNGGIGGGDCDVDDVEVTSHTDSEIPSPGAAFYYVVRGDADTISAGTYDNPPGNASPDEGRDAEAGSAGGNPCTDRP